MAMSATFIINNFIFTDFFLKKSINNNKKVLRVCIPTKHHVYIYIF